VLEGGVGQRKQARREAVLVVYNSMINSKANETFRLCGGHWDPITIRNCLTLGRPPSQVSNPTAHTVSPTRFTLAHSPSTLEPATTRTVTYILIAAIDWRGKEL
jgi:hypothetical protein